MQYAKRNNPAIVVDAIRADQINSADIQALAGAACDVRPETPLMGAVIIIHTPGGDVVLQNGDYVLKVQSGQVYVMTPQQFERVFREGVVDVPPISVQSNEAVTTKKPTEGAQRRHRGKNKPKAGE